MKKLLAITLATFVASSLLGADSYKLAFRDYAYDDKQVSPISFGVCTWTDDEHDLTVGGYGNFTFISVLDDRLRFGAGLCIVPGNDYPIDLRFNTALTTRLLDSIELGVWYAPFWGLASKDDPFGLMVGYVLRF